MTVTIKVRKDGPYAIDLTTGAINLIDHEGNPIPISLPEGKTTVALCRCGGSSRKPFCDGTHSKIGFKGAEQAAREFDAARQSGQSGSGPAGPT
jgi:3-phenylpropionate/trans-cinnamate dioxygenase ferredoxin subunit